MEAQGVEVVAEELEAVRQEDELENKRLRDLVTYVENAIFQGIG
jgi:hypothetical protein